MGWPKQQLLRFGRHNDRVSGGSRRLLGSSPSQALPTGSKTSPTAAPNTIAFAEAVVGPDSGGYQTKQIQQLFRNGTNVYPWIDRRFNQPFDANQNIPAVMKDMQTCQNAALTLPSGDGTQGTLNEDDKGERWAADDGGFSLINTIVPPSSIQYSFACCSFSGSYGCDDGVFQNVNSMHPGRR